LIRPARRHHFALFKPIRRTRIRVRVEHFEDRVDEKIDIGTDGKRSFRSMADATNLGMAYQIVVPADGGERRFSFVGQRCLALNGVSAEAVMADPALLYEMILPEHRQAFAAAEAKAMAEQEPFDLEIAMRRADGEVRWHRIASLPSRLPDGSTLWDGLQIDITERREMAAELDEQRRRLQMAVETTGLGLWEWDLRADTVVWSERQKAMFGLPADAEVTIERYLGLVHPDDVDKVGLAYMAARDQSGEADFAVEHRVVTPTGEPRWILAHGRVTHDEGGPRLVLGTSLDVTQRRTAEERRKLLMGELAHRAKNGMQVMMAMVHQAARSSATVADFEQVLTARMHAMATSQDLVTAAGGGAVQLSQLLSQVLEAFDLGRFDIDPAVDELTVTSETAIGLALLSHELGTNAVKYGALSIASGRVAIARREAADGVAVIEWRESGGPVVRPSNRRGFGTRLLEAALRDRGGKVEPSFAPEGFSAVVEFRAAEPAGPTLI
jgi:PAS domain S-box-containing protein